MTFRRPRGLRARLVVIVSLGGVVMVGALTLAFNVVLRQGLEHDANSLLRARAPAQLATVTLADGRLGVREAPDDAALDSQVWVFAGRRPIERARTEPRNQRAAVSLAGGRRRFLDVPATDARLYAVPIVLGGRRMGTLVLGISLAPYERTASRALLFSLAFALVVLAGIALAARWSIRAALGSVSRMTAEAADWSEHDLDHRFALGEPHDELTRLAATFDDLLGRLSASLRHEQHFSAEISHELRTPLAKLVAEADLALRRERQPADYREALVAIRRDGEQLTRTLETLIEVARTRADPRQGTSDAGEVATSAVEASAPRGSARGVQIELAPARAGLRVGADPQLVERILAPVLENACRYARRVVTVAVARDGEGIAFTIADDGPGVAEGDRGRVFEPGFQGEPAGEAPASGNGAGLGLALAQRLARAAGGAIECAPSPDGARFVVRLPSA